MSVDELSKTWGLTPRGVLHVGAHQGEEAIEYENHGWLPVIWIEAQPDLVSELRERLPRAKHKVIEAAVWDQDDIRMVFKVASSSQSSSLLEFGTHAAAYPSIHTIDEFEISTKRLDGLLKDQLMPNFLNLDIQGAEGRAIRGLGDLLKSVDAIYTEVNSREVYLGCTQISSMDEFLESEGFTRVAVRWVLGMGWGDALYLRTASSHVAYWRKAYSALYAAHHYIQQIFGFSANEIKILIRKVWKYEKRNDE